jgi:hypothetical protein
MCELKDDKDIKIYSYFNSRIKDSKMVYLRKHDILYRK